MPADLRGKRIIVTGAATGIGRAVALRVSAYGGIVAVFDANAIDGANTVKEISEAGGDAKYWQVDIRDEVVVSEGVEAANDWLTGIDILIHMAWVCMKILRESESCPFPFFETVNLYFLAACAPPQPNLWSIL